MFFFSKRRFSTAIGGSEELANIDCFVRISNKATRAKSFGQKRWLSVDFDELDVEDEGRVGRDAAGNTLGTVAHVLQKKRL